MSNAMNKFGEPHVIENLGNIKVRFAHGPEEIKW